MECRPSSFLKEQCETKGPEVALVEPCDGKEADEYSLDSYSIPSSVGTTLQEAPGKRSWK